MSARDRTVTDFLRKLAAVLLVLTSLTTGIIGLGMTTTGRLLTGILLIAVVPTGIWLATLLTPEGGTSGYCDENI